MIYNIIITPLIQVFEFFYTLFFEITKSEGISVVGLSFVVTLCCLPLYMVAEQWQEIERGQQTKMKPKVAKIKKNFKGSEQYMILSTYYRQNHYHPIMALRSSFSLFFQIPFFMAAYSFLSHLESLKGVSFLFIKDFGSADATFHIGSFAVNVLPIAMTLINCISGIIYSKGHGIREKIQIFGCAFVFLVLLYDSPAGLVVYWTMNNILSLVKNIFYKLKNPKKVLYIIACIFALICMTSPVTFLSSAKPEIKAFLFLFAIVLLTAPFVIKALSKVFSSHFAFLDQNNKVRFAVYFASSLILALLAGLVIPSMLMQSETVQFCYIEDCKSPFIFLRATFYQALGIFFVWPLCFYAMFSSSVKKVMAVFTPVLAFTAIINCFAFSGNYGPINPNLFFMTTQTFAVSLKQLLLNASVIVFVCALTIFLMNKKAKIISSLSFIILLGFALLVAKNAYLISVDFKKIAPPQKITKVEPVYHLSKTGKNVIVLMQDRLFGPFIDPVMEEKPEFIEKMDGFVHYKNVISQGYLTMLGVPGIFGGYDYTPYQMNKRTDETIQQKHNQAILTMPVLFHEAGWDTTVSSMPYENYNEYPVTDMYADYPYVSRVNTRGLYTDLWYSQNNMTKVTYLAKLIKRNFIWFSFFKMVSPVFRRAVYHNEYWISYNLYDEGLPRFIDNYSELCYFPQLLDTISDKSTFLMMDNCTVHESTVLQAPDYTVAENVTQFGKSEWAHERHFCTMVATFMRYTELIEWLKKEGVYDNTRIIIVSDHGTAIDTPYLENNLPGIMKECFSCSLLVKDFNQHGPMTTDMTFMTNADTPYLATKDIIPDAKNPFTGTPLKVEDKEAILTTCPSQSTRIRHDSGFAVKDNEWFTVRDNIFDSGNWAQLNTDK